jgi:hypothetical protein
VLWTTRKIINNFRHKGTSHWQDLVCQILTY